MPLIENSVGELPYKMLDMDQHSVEAEDCFTRYMPKDKLDTSVRPIRSATGKKILLANDRIVTALEHDLDQHYIPGSLAEMLRQRASGDATDAERFYGPIEKEYLDKGARLVQLDEQQIERSIMYPGGWGLFAWAYLKGNVLYDNLESFNRWIDEDWGFNTKDRIYAPALLSLDNLERGVQELDRVLNAGAKFIMLPPGPVNGRSPGDPYFDPFWARINEAKAIVSYHITEYHYQENVASALGMGTRAAVPVLGLAVAEHLRRASHHRHALGPGLRQPVRPVPRHQGAGQRVRRGVDPALHQAHGQEPGHGPQRPVARRAAARAPECHLQAADQGRSLSGGRHGGPRRAARRRRGPRHGLGLAPRRRACASRPTSTPGSKGSGRTRAGGSSATTPWSSSALARRTRGRPYRRPCTTGGVVARLARPDDHPCGVRAGPVARSGRRAIMIGNAQIVDSHYCLTISSCDLGHYWTSKQETRP